LNETATQKDEISLFLPVYFVLIQKQGEEKEKERGTGTGKVRERSSSLT
jgi:hypothetical protein